MVKSGLDSESVEELGGVPRVSQYRLASHLGMAFCVFALCLRLGLGVKRDWQIAKMGKGLSGVKGVQQSLVVLEGKTAGRVRVAVTALSGLVFFTAFSGELENLSVSLFSTLDNETDFCSFFLLSPFPPLFPLTVSSSLSPSLFLFLSFALNPRRRFRRRIRCWINLQRVAHDGGQVLQPLSWTRRAQKGLLLSQS